MNSETILRVAAVSSFVRFSNAVIRSPLLWGVAIAVGFYTLTDSSLWPTATFERYAPRNPLGYPVTVTFFVAIASLAIKACDGFAQARALRYKLLGPTTPGMQPAECCATLMASLAALPETQQSFYLVQRLRDALQSIERRDAVEALDEELKYLAARDMRNLWQSYGWVLVAIVLLPIFAVVGTSLNPPVTRNLQGSLSIFVEIALSQVAVLVVATGAMVSFDLRLLRRVDVCVEEELGSRFQRLGTSSDPQVLAVRRMADAVVQVTDRLVQRQVELWQSTIQAAHSHWNHLADASLNQTQAALETSLRKVLTEFADQLASGQQLVAGTSAPTSVGHSSESAAKLKLFAPEDFPNAVPAEAKAA